MAYRMPFGLSTLAKRVHTFHKTNPQVLDFLVNELREVQANGRPRASVGSLWHYARGVLTEKHRAPGESFVMSNNLFPHYSRMIVIFHPTLNGFFEMGRSQADEDFGTMLEPVRKSMPKGYIRGLLWADGNAIERGWRPSILHEPKQVERLLPLVRKAA